MKRKIITIFLSASLLLSAFNLSGCTVILAGGGVIAKAVSWLTFWKKDDTSTSGMSDSERMKQAFADYTNTAKNAMNSAQTAETPTKPTDTEDISYIQNVNTETLDEYDFFAIWLENYQKDHPDSDFSEIGGEVTEEKLKSFFVDSYFKTTTVTSFKTAVGTVLTEVEKNSLLITRQQKRERLSAVIGEIEQLEESATATTATETTAPTTPPPADELSNLYGTQANYIAILADSSIPAWVRSDYTEQLKIVNERIVELERQAILPITTAPTTTATATMSSELPLKYLEKSQLETYLTQTKITATITITIGKNPDIISNLGLETENVDLIKQFLHEISK
jgi:hypothetical protein